MSRLRAVVAAIWTYSAVLWGRGVGEEQLDFSTVDVNKLAEHVHGTEILVLENRYRDQSGYKFEDFFWTGSGEEPIGDNPWNIENPETVYETKTIIQTIFIDSPHTPYNESSHDTNSTKCTENCISTPAPHTPDGHISPSRTIPIPTDNEMGPGDEEELDLFGADRQFWLLTVLKSDGKDPVIIDLKNSLAKLYKKAFERQQAKHLGINIRDKREFLVDLKERGKRAAVEKPISIYIHNMNKTKLNGDQKIQVLYHVSVAGKPVPAVTAAGDMRYVSDDEVRDVLGYPFLVKAEPYLKPAEPQSLSSAKNTWVFMGVSIIAFLIFLLVIAFLLLGLKKRKRVATPTNLGTENRQHIFERAVGKDNEGFLKETEECEQGESPTYVKYKNETSTMTRSGVESPNRAMSITSSSSSSSTSLDISPMLNFKKKTPRKKPFRPRAAYNKTSPITLTQIPREIFDSDTSSSRKDSPDTIFCGNYDPGVMSPKSYLSMPSVKAFPRDTMPEPLNKVLEPVSVMHFDIPEDETTYGDPRSSRHISALTRYGSVGAVEDPGVIGPIVWNMHQQRLQHGVSVDEGMGDLKGDSISKMRRRFHDLLDDTFSLFGSRRESPVGVDTHSTRVPVEIKSHSAVNARANDDLKAPTPKPRPKTSCLRKEEQNPRSPKGAWSSKAPSPLVRPLSAGVINPAPRINTDHILAEGRFRPNDPAVPLISAIRSELERVSLPGSTNDVRD